jgi:hypothetical protein
MGLAWEWSRYDTAGLTVRTGASQSYLTAGSRSRVGKKCEKPFNFKTTKYGQVISPIKIILYDISVYRCRLNTKHRFLTFALSIEGRCLEGASWERHFVEFLFVIYYVRTHDRSFLYM